MSDLDVVKSILIQLKQLDDKIAASIHTRDEVLKKVYSKVLIEFEKLEYENNSLRHKLKDMENVRVER